MPPVPLAAVLEDNHIIPLVGMILGGFIAIVCIIFGALKSIAATRAREQTRREIAAYVAEGSMTSEEGEKLLKAAPPGSEWRC